MSKRSTHVRTVSRRQQHTANRIEQLEVRLALSGAPWESDVELNAKATDSFPAILTTWLPDGVTRAELAEQAGPYADYAANNVSAGQGTAGAPITALIPYNELEPVGVTGLNDTPAAAELVAGFGTAPGEDNEADVAGDLASVPPTIGVLVPLPEDEGSIPLATPTGLTSGNVVIASGVIGDGPFGSGGLGSGDFDFYQIAGVGTGSTITIDVDTPVPFGDLDPFVVLWDSSGTVVDFNDDDGASFDSFLKVTVPTADDYYLSIAGFGSFAPNDPFDSSSGPGAGSEGTYDVTIGLDLPEDVDVYAVELEPGDVFGATVFGGATHLTFSDPSGMELIGSSQDLAFAAHPIVSPLPGGGNASLSWVVDTAGTYTLTIDQGAGPYLAQLRAYRTELEQQNRRDHQILFLDFDGETIDATQYFGFGNSVANLSPLSSYLAGWGLTADDEDAVIDAITASVAETFRDVGLMGNNGDFETDGVDGHFDIEIVTSRDSTDSFGFPLDPFGTTNVSRVIVGGSIDELGIGTIGIAESIDVGNFETKETAVVLLDLLSAPASNPNSLNQFVGLPTDIIELVGVGVGNITAHEAGHFFGTWHTDQFNAVANIMDQGGNLPNTVGVGPDGIFGTSDDEDVDFGKDTFVPNEGFTGTEDTLNAIAFGLSTGLNDPGLIVVDSSPANDEQLFSKPTDFTIQFIDPVDPLTVDSGDLTVNGIAADLVSGSGDTWTFHYDSSPVTLQGLQTMSMAAGAVSRLSDGDGVAPFNANFGYDEILMEVISVDPVDGSVVELPFNSVTVQVNEPYADASVGTNDLMLSEGSVVGFNLVDDLTIEYLLSGISSEGNFTIQMPDGALTDEAGNLGLGFAVNYVLDFGQFPYPIPLTAKNPLGSLIYDPFVDGTIGLGDIDRFTLSVDPGQTVTVVVEPATDTLQPLVELGVGARHVAADEADGPGQAAVIQTAGQFVNQSPLPTTFGIAVAGLNDTQGAYRLQVILNAAVEAENYDGPSNDVEPQNISDSFLTFWSREGVNPGRGAALGTTDDDGGDDLYSFHLRRGESIDVALTGAPGLNLQLFDPMGNLVAEDLDQSSIVNGGFETGDFTGWTVVETNAPYVPWQVTGGGLGGGFGFATTEPQEGAFVAWNGFDGLGPMQYQMWQDFTVPLTPIAELNWKDRVQWNMTFGATLPRDYNVQLRDPATNAVLATLFSFSTGDPLVNPTGNTGWQSHAVDLTAFAGQTVRLYIEETIPEPFVGPGQIEFDDFSLDVGGPTNVDNALRNVIANETGLYTVRISGAPGVDYSLVATRNADFDVEDNNSIATAQPILATAVNQHQFALGHVSGSSATLYASTRNGGLFTIDTTTGTSSLVGVLPNGATEIEHDNATGRSFVQFPDGFFAGQEFDIDTGAGIGSVVPNGGSYNGLEWVGNTLYGTAIVGPGGPSEFRVLDPFTGASTTVGPTGVGPISGLAYDQASGVMYGIAGGPGPADLFTIDVTTGAATPVGSTGIQAGSLEFGPDGNLYAGGTGANVGELHQIDVATAASTFVGPTGIGPVTGLALRQTPATSDFYEVTLTGRRVFFAGTTTPAGGPGEFVNGLDAMMRLYDAAGNLVASDDNSFIDGRNPLLRYRVPAGEGGTYYVEILSSDATPSPTSGEYLLWMFGASKAASGEMAAAAIRIGDSNRDGYFDSSDLVTVFQAGEYEDGIAGNSTFEEGDWNHDGEFDSSDLVLAFQNGSYDSGFELDYSDALDEFAAALERQIRTIDAVDSSDEANSNGLQVERRQTDLRVDDVFAHHELQDDLLAHYDGELEELVKVLKDDLNGGLI